MSNTSTDETVILELYGFSTDSFTSQVKEEEITEWFNSMSKEDRDDIDDFLFEQYEDSFMDNGLEADSVTIRKIDTGEDLSVNTEKVEQATSVKSFSDCYFLVVVQMWKGVYGTCEIPVSEEGFSPEKLSILIDDSENRLLGIKYDNAEIEIDSGDRDMRGKGSEITLYQYDKNGEETILDLASMYSEHLASKLSPNKLYKTYLKKVERWGLDLEKVPMNERTRDICLVAVKNCGRALEYVPDDIKDKELCMAAVQEDGASLEYVPDALKDKELCLAAVQHNGSALEYVPEVLKDKELCMAAVQEDGASLEYVPDALKDKELCLAAVQNLGALKHVPEALFDSHLCSVAVLNDGDALVSVPQELITKKLCLEAVAGHDRSFNYVPEEFKDKEVCLVYVAHWGGNLQFIPEEMKDVEVCLAAVKKTEDAIKYVPKKIKNEILSLIDL